MKAVKAARATAVVAMKVPRAFATSRLGGYLGTGQMPLSTPKYRFLALQLTSSVKLDIKIAINTQGNYCKALFIVFTTGFVLEMAHVQIRGGVADWYWTADLPAVLVLLLGCLNRNVALALVGLSGLVIEGHSSIQVVATYPSGLWKHMKGKRIIGTHEAHGQLK